MNHEDEASSWAQEVLVTLEAPFSDERGVIQPLVDAKMLSAVLISSNRGAVRANHYHKTDWHYCYVVQGCIEYFYRTHGSVAPPESVLVRTGSMAFTPPMVDHAMAFPEDTVFLVLGRNRRDQRSYEADVVRIDLIRP